MRQRQRNMKEKMIMKKKKSSSPSSSSSSSSLLCIPVAAIVRESSSRSSNGGKGKHSISLLQRLRHAFFRLVMLTAVSKTTRFCESPSIINLSKPVARFQNYQQHHGEALEDCIEFIKKSASAPEHPLPSSPPPPPIITINSPVRVMD